ncbi:MAG TPA: glycosyltransferase family 39 protein [Candidatus Acidoferrales bacterium]|nr:glycosyltransferase family 39 protein [Candidatus Acidoferrales bacterium]
MIRSAPAARRVSGAAAGAIVTVCAMSAFAADGWRAYFTPDDMMNLYGAWSASPVELLQGHRPLGGLVYRALFAVFGLNPLPFRVVCMCLVLANLWLLYLFCLRLTHKRETAALACLLGAYHAHLADLYYSTGTLYDVLSYFLILATLVYYFRICDLSGYPSWRRTAILTGLYSCALATKELAVVVPPLVLLYELIYHSRAGLMRRARFLYVSVPVTAAFILYRTSSSHAMTRNPNFFPHISLHAFLAGWTHYLPDLFYGTVAFNSFKVVVLLGGMLAVAAWTRRRELLYGWCVILVVPLPFIFIEPRGFFEMYLSLAGWYLYAAAALVALRDSVPGWAERLGVRPGQLALFAAAALLLFVLHRREKPLGNQWVPETHAEVRQILEPLQRRSAPLPRGARVLFLSDPYPVDEWLLTFVFRLYYQDKTIRVDRVKPWPQLASREAQAGYDRVYALDEAGLKEVARRE